MKQLDTTSEWERVVEENHRKAVEQCFEADVQEIKKLCYEDTSGSDREPIMERYRAERSGKLERVSVFMMAVSIFVAGIISSMEISGADNLLTRAVVGLIAMTAGVVIGMCLRKKER